jgi:ABC-type transport system involved in multi-copper enzyme maturation permease subunit
MRRSAPAPQGLPAASASRRVARAHAAGGVAADVLTRIAGRVPHASVRLVAGREIRLLRRRRAVRGALVLLAAVAWLPPLVLSLRAGSLGLATFEESVLLTMALGAVVLPLLALLAGTDLFAGEIEDQTLTPLITLPISRAAWFAGKYLGRTSLLSTSYVAAFGSVALAIGAFRGTAGWQDYSVVLVSGLLLCLVCGGIGAALGVSAHGRVRAFGSALVVWLAMVFVLDALLLAVFVAFAPLPPQQVGTHGHSELTPPGREMPIHDRFGHGPLAAPEPGARSSAVWLLALNPTDLFRVSAFAWGPALRTRMTVALPEADSLASAVPLVVGWLVWLSVPPLVAVWRFRRVALR